MSLLCPACQASYNIDAALLGPNGRKVRCAKCGNTWLALPPLPLPQEPVRPSKPAAKLEQMDPQIKIIPPADDVFASYVKQSATKQPEPAIEETHRSFRPVESRALTKPESAWMVWFHQLFIPVSLVVLAIGIAVLIVGRGDVMKKAPWTLPYYTFLDLSPLPPGGGLAIVNVHDESRFSQVDNDLVIHGDLINRTGSTLKVPLFKLEITSPTGQMRTFMERGPVDQIGPSAVVPFTLERAGFAAQDWDVTVTFGDKDDRDNGKPMQVVDTPTSGSKENK